MPQATETTTITVKKVFHNEAKDGKKESWTIYATNETQYRVWDGMIADQLPEGMTRAVSYTTKDWQGKTFHNIVGIAGLPESAATAANPFLDDDEQNNLNIMTDTKPVYSAPKPVAPTLATEVKVLVEERIAAYDSAVSLYIAGKIDLKEIGIYADRALDYYHNRTTPHPVTPPNSSGINSEDYLK